jgi:chemotaxis protein CheC
LQDTAIGAKLGAGGVGDVGADLKLNELQHDALAELVNIGVGRAAVSLATMAGEEVILTVPAISAVTPQQAAELLRGALAEDLLCVCESFTGAISGLAHVVFNEVSAKALVEAVTTLPTDQIEAESVADEALTEVGNVLIQAWLSTMANELRQGFAVGVPRLMRTTPAGMFDKTVDLVLFVYVNFHLKGRRVRGYIVLTVDLPSGTTLTSLLDEWIERVVGVG